MGYMFDENDRDSLRYLVSKYIVDECGRNDAFRLIEKIKTSYKPYTLFPVVEYTVIDYGARTYYLVTYYSAVYGENHCYRTHFYNKTESLEEAINGTHDGFIADDGGIYFYN